MKSKEPTKANGESGPKVVGKTKNGRMKTGETKPPSPEDHSMIGRVTTMTASPTEPIPSVVMYSEVGTASVTVSLRQQLRTDQPVGTERSVGVIYTILLIVFQWCGAALFSATGLEDLALEEYPMWWNACVNGSLAWPDEECENATLAAIDEWEHTTVMEGGLLVPEQFSYGLIYVITAITTIGYGRVVAMGRRAQSVMIVYSFVIPVFLSFLNHLAEVFRGYAASIYNKLWNKLCQRDKTDQCPDLIPFLMMVVFQGVYYCSAAAVLYAFDQFDSYFDAYYFIFQSVALIGLGDVMPVDVNIQLFFMVFIIFGAILFQLCSIVMEEWMRKTVRAMANAIADTMAELPRREPPVSITPPTPTLTQHQRTVHGTTATTIHPYATVHCRTIHCNTRLPK